MSIIIKGMEMPKNCNDCPLNYDQMACKVTGTRWWSDTMVLMGFDSDKERLYDCPLVEIPTPHGRLGDLDKLNIHDISPVDGFCVMGVTEEDIELAETVIEAEGEKDGR